MLRIWLKHGNLLAGIHERGVLLSEIIYGLSAVCFRNDSCARCFIK